MLHRPLRIALAIAACAALPMLAIPAAAQKVVTDVPPVWKHRVTDTSFPEQIGDFHRTDVVEYNADGSDASAGYDLMRDGKKLATVTLYIYPPFTGGGCAAEYGAIKQGVFGAEPYKNIKLVSEARVPSPSGRNPGVADLAVFSFDFAFGAGPVQAVRSEAYSFCAAGGKWIVSYRATSPAAVDVSADVTMLFRAIAWPKLLDE